MRHLLAIALVTVREVLRRKLQINLLFFGLAMVGATHLAGRLTLGEGYRILADLGLTAMQLIGTLVAVFVGSNLVSGDIERRVLHPVLAKPVSRTAYVLGRYLGLAIVLTLNLAVMAGLFALVLAADAGGLQPIGRALVDAILLLGLQFLVVGAVAILFSTITSPTLAAVFTLAVAIAGQLTGEIRALWRGPGTWIPQLIWYRGRVPPLQLPPLRCRLRRERTGAGRPGLRAARPPLRKSMAILAPSDGTPPAGRRTWEPILAPLGILLLAQGASATNSRKRVVKPHS